LQPDSRYPASNPSPSPWATPSQLANNCDARSAGGGRGKGMRGQTNERTALCDITRERQTELRAFSSLSRRLLPPSLCPARICPAARGKNQVTL